MGRFILKYRNFLLLCMLVVTMLVSYFVNQDRMRVEAASVTIPVVQVTAAPVSKLDSFRVQRDEAALTDIAALQALCDAPSLDTATREDAAAQLMALVDAREKQLAIEGSLALSSYAPCVAVVEPDILTIVTGRETLPEEDQALLFAMAKEHAGILPSGVRVICADAHE